MAGKYALYLPYKVLDSLSSGNVTDSQFREFIMGLAEYDRTGTFPASPTAGFSMMYELVKSDLDFAKAKYEDIVEKRRQAGKKGGAPKGNKNALGNRGGGAPSGNRNAVKDGYLDQIPEIEPEKQTQAKQAKQAKQTEPDNSSQITDNSKQIKDMRSSGSSEVVFSKPPPPQTTTAILINKCKSLGYSFDNLTAQDILNTGIVSSWLIEPFTYPEYIAEIIQESYADKPPEQKRKLFRAILAAEDRIDAFPEWRKNKETEAVAQEEHRQRDAAAQEKRQRIDQARSNKPEVCDHCGNTITIDRDFGSCPYCNWDYFFDEEKTEWEFAEHKSLLEEFKNIMQNNHNQKRSEAEASKKLSEYFLRVWQQNSDVFNFTAKIKNQKDWDAFWKACTYSENDIDNRMGNYISGVKSRDIERRFIPASPDSFVLGGWLQKSAEPFNKSKHRIANDNTTDDDVSEYFTEIEAQPEEIEF